MKTNILILTAIILLFTGCSLQNPFGIGYEKSVSEDSKTFGVSGSPHNIYNYREDLRKVQDDYLNSKISDVLYFAIDKEGNVMVKQGRTDNWINYETSNWKRHIDKALALEKKKQDDLNLIKNKQTKRPADFRVNMNDIKVTTETDLSIKYKQQGPLIVTKTKIGDIIRDNGLIQQVMVANYVDHSGDLISSHEVFVVVREAQWVVGEKTPKSVKVKTMPTPFSSDLINEHTKTTNENQDVIKNFINEQKITKSIEEAGEKSILTDEDLETINAFINN